MFLTGINLRLQYRRRIFKSLVAYFHGSVLGVSMFILLLACGLDVSYALDYWIWGSFVGLLIISLMQLISNHEFFSSVYFSIRSRLKGSSK